MSGIVFIAFDEEKFKNRVNCERWLRNSQEYDCLLNNKGWKLKSVAKNYWMSEEGRKVFQWHSPKLAYVKGLVIERPDPNVIIIKNNGSSYFTETELPPLSNKFQRAQREKEFQIALKDQKRLDKEEKKKQKKRKRDTHKPIKEPIVAEGDLIKPKKRVPKKKPKPEVPISSDLPEFPLTTEEEMQLKTIV